MKKITLPMTKEQLKALQAGDSVLLSGTIYTARDCAHRRIFELLDAGMVPPFTLEGAFIYYAGPCPAPQGKATGSCGPTTSARMNAFAPRLLDLGLGGMIGKGEMNEAVRAALVKNGGVYFAAIGGAGAFYANAVKRSELVAFPDLLSEAIYKFEVEDFPLVVAMDSHGTSIY
ncbi:MAG: fumarate hydratase C-terminal domain-containing protein [Clostridia bacterium]|nr:fumarate hydratase C-terminal domain-containing protein [Clostridia bacterium]